MVEKELNAEEEEDQNEQHFFKYFSILPAVFEKIAAEIVVCSILGADELIRTSRGSRSMSSPTIECALCTTSFEITRSRLLNLSVW